MIHEKTQTNPNLTQNEQNELLFEDSELGSILGPAYREAVNLDPRLANVRVVPITDPNEQRFGYAQPKWARDNTSGQHEVHIRLDNLDQTLAYYGEAMQNVPQAIDVIAKRLGVDRSRVTPQMMLVQSHLHELGHITEMIDNEADPAALLLRNKREKAALPIGNATAGALVRQGSPAQQFVESNWANIQSQLGVGDMNELVGMQAEAYRSMTSETIADNFATSVFEMNPQMYDQLAAQTVDRYRSMPVDA